MELRQMIEIAAQRKGEQKNLAKALGMNPNDLSSAKAGRRGLPAIACGKLAEILGIDRWTVIAASELVTERNEEKRNYFRPFVLNGSTALAAALSALMVSTETPTDAIANDTYKESLSASKPAPLTEKALKPIYIM